MNQKNLDVVGIGSAIVDVIAQGDETFLHAHGMTKGAMGLLFTPEEAEAIYQSMENRAESSGGSCANTLAGLASMGGAGAFVGVVRDDELGDTFRSDMRSVGVEFDTPAATEGPPTASCLIFVTDDAERTMNTYLGAASGLTTEHIDAALIGRSKVVYLEGYLWDVDQAKQAMRAAMDAAKSSGAEVAFTLSDGFCVERHRAEFLELLEGPVDVLFANEDEIKSLYEVDTFEEAAALVVGHCSVTALTRSEKGAVILVGDDSYEISALQADVVDTTGAGDQFAAGFLFGYTRGLDPATCGRLGVAAAAEVISHVGARPRVSLANIAAEIVEP